MLNNVFQANPCTGKNVISKKTQARSEKNKKENSWLTLSAHSFKNTK